MRFGTVRFKPEFSIRRGRILDKAGNLDACRNLAAYSVPKDNFLDFGKTAISDVTPGSLRGCGIDFTACLLTCMILKSIVFFLFVEYNPREMAEC